MISVMHLLEKLGHEILAIFHLYYLSTWTQSSHFYLNCKKKKSNFFVPMYTKSTDYDFTLLMNCHDAGLVVFSLTNSFIYSNV